MGEIPNNSLARRYQEQRAADAVFWLAHDRGRLRIKPTVLALGLAGGLLGELFLDHRIELFQDQVVLRHEVFTVGYQRRLHSEPPAPPRDDLSAEIFTNIKADQGAGLGRWLAAIATISVPRVTLRLETAKTLDPLEPRITGRLLRWATREPTHTPKGPVAEQVWAVLSTRLLRGAYICEDQRDADALVVGIATVTGLLEHLLVGGRPSAFAKAQRLVAELPGDLAQLLAQIETAIAKGALLPKA